MRNRSRLEIYLDLIRVVSKQSDITSIRRKANLPLGETERHLDFLASQGLVKIVGLDGSRARYELTSRGLDILEALQTLTEHRHPLFKYALR